MILRPDLVTEPPGDLDKKIKLVSALEDSELHALGLSRDDLNGLLA
jgi:hypothetical protein